MANSYVQASSEITPINREVVYKVFQDVTQKINKLEEEGLPEDYTEPRVSDVFDVDTLLNNYVLTMGHDCIPVQVLTGKDGGYETEGDKYWVSDAGDGNFEIELTGIILQAMIQAEPEGTVWRIPYAFTCDKPRLDEFGGGIMQITKNKLFIATTEDLLNTVARCCQE